MLKVPHRSLLPWLPKRNAAAVLVAVGCCVVRGISEGVDVSLSHIMYYQSVLDSQLSHENLNLLFALTNFNIKLTVLWGS